MYILLGLLFLGVSQSSATADKGKKSAPHITCENIANTMSVMNGGRIKMLINVLSEKLVSKD